MTRVAAPPVLIIDNGTTKYFRLTMVFILQITHVGNDRLKVAATDKLFGGKPFLSVPHNGGSCAQKRGSRGSKWVN